MNKSPRQLAWEVLFEVDNSGIYSNLVLPRILNSSSLEDRDRGFVTEIVYGTLRMRGLLDAILKRNIDREIQSIDLKTLTVLRIGVYQKQIMNTPDHAVVNESVNLAKRVSGAGSSSFVNATMRRICEDITPLPESLSERHSHPQWIINAFADSLKDMSLVERQLESDNLTPIPNIIAWPGRCEPDELIAEGAIPIPGSARGFTFKGNPSSLSAIRERRAGVQDYGSQLVVENFFATDIGNLRWLDLCAGPGGKAAYLDSLISDGEFYANEISSERTKLLRQVINRGKVISYDGRLLPEEIGSFDRILIDAPCTGLGALRRRPEVRWRRQPSDLRGLIQLQRELLESAASRLNPGGIIGYATCSPHLGETKLQVRDFLKNHQDFKRLPVSKPPHEAPLDVDGDLQLWTYAHGTDAMYLALLQRAS